jgi:hypothetical protein
LDIQENDAQFSLPLKLEETLPGSFQLHLLTHVKIEFFIRIEVNQLNTKPSVKFGKPLNITSVENGAFVIEEKMKDVKLNENLVMVLPDLPPGSIFSIISLIAF